ncbi:MAG: hypothetical protein CL693_05415 [Cellvibrionaceae bacterium]|nr:hypothetical protein [Cellvibrionaceae bacterium]|tara:strand:+ start:23443 stop:24147 length:705 start_codon:yes stop_codon:yes gene_type:complete
MKRIIAGVLLTFGLNVQSAELPKPFNAVYKAEYGSLTITATRSLQKLSDDSMELRFAAKSWLARIEEVSHFQWDSEGQLVPTKYHYQRTGLGRDRQALLNFDWQNQKVVNNVQNKPWSMDLPQAALDKLSYQLQLRHDLINAKQDMSYKIADGGRLKTYDFRILGEETLSTPLGQLNAVKVERIRKNAKRTTHLWLAKDWNHLVVKIRQTEKDGKHYEINIASADLNGEPVTGF